MSYIDLRITWVGPTKPSQNRLNEPLLRVIEEKDRILSGLIASNRVTGISTLASSLSHQLSQPLTAIALRADTTRRPLVLEGKDPGMIASLDEISHQSTKLAELVQNLRRLFSSKSVEYAPIHLQKMIDEILEIVNPSLASKKIALHKNFRDDLVVYGDSIQLQQVLINVLNNAIDDLDSNKNSDKLISIDLFAKINLITIKIKDNGGGIPETLLPNIFDLYKTTKEGGLRVGLWLCKSIMESHHGNITAFNFPSGGTVFRVEMSAYLNSK